MIDRWTEEQFDEMGWHDNHVHALGVAEGEYGAGTLWFELDYILQWTCEPDSPASFKLAPAILSFRDVTELRIVVDYVVKDAGLVPFSLEGIERDEDQWTLRVNWPEGGIRFRSPGFEQRLVGVPVESDQQVLSAERRQASKHRWLEDSP